MKKYLLVLFLLLASASAFAVPQQIYFQGVLLDSSGNAVTGTRDMTFKIYSAATGGVALAADAHAGVSVNNGLYTVKLNINSSIFNGNDRYIGVTVGTDAEMAPRVQVLTVPYVYNAANADTAVNADNAAALNTLHASSSATANYLYPLGADSKFPVNVITQGPGSGLDSDTLDGKHASEFALASGNYVLFAPTTMQSTASAVGIWVGNTNSDGAAISAETTGVDAYAGYFANSAGGVKSVKLATGNTAAEFDGGAVVVSNGAFSALNNAQFGDIGTSTSLTLYSSIDSDVVPDQDDARDLGKSDLRWSNIYAAMFYGDGSQLTGIGSGSFVFFGTAEAQETSQPNAIYVRNTASSGKGISAEATGGGTGYAGYFTIGNNNFGSAVYGKAGTAGGTNYGGYFEAGGDGGQAVRGYASSTNQDSFGGSFGAEQGTGVRGYVNSIAVVGQGVWGTTQYDASAGTGRGGLFETWMKYGTALVASQEIEGKWANLGTPTHAGHFGGDVTVEGSVFANNFYGDGSHLTGISLGGGLTTVESIHVTQNSSVDGNSYIGGKLTVVGTIDPVAIILQPKAAATKAIQVRNITDTKDLLSITQNDGLLITADAASRYAQFAGPSYAGYFNGPVNVSGSMTATDGFYGDGSHLTGIVPGGSFVQFNPSSVQSTTETPAIWVQSTGSAGRAISAETTQVNSIAVYGFGGCDVGNKSSTGGYFLSNGDTGYGVRGKSTSSALEANYGGYFEASGEAGRAVYGRALAATNQINYGGEFIANGQQGRGVYGKANSSTGTNYGGYFESASSAGYGLFANNTVSSKKAYLATGAYAGIFTGDVTIEGKLTVTSTVDAIYAKTSSANDSALYATNESSGDFAVLAGTAPDGAASAGYFKTNGTHDALIGYAASAADTVHGIVGKTDTIDGGGVYGSADNTGAGDTAGGYFIDRGTKGRGVYGLANTTSSGLPGSYGGYFIAKDGTQSPGVTGGGYGLLATNEGSGTWAYLAGPTNTGEGTAAWAGYFKGTVVVNGDLSISGALSKGSGTFLIDHPLDPANKVLRHSFVESPDMKNIYDGVAALDANGEAIIDLPAYFEALNKDFRYQLTTIGGYAQVYIAEKIKDNKFKIAGGKPGMEVSWMVTGSRQDAYAKKHPIIVEEEKTTKGIYLYPDAFKN